MTDEPLQKQHWADRTADLVLAAGRPPVISTGISPSGEIHVGHLREILTGDAIYRVLVSRGVATRFNFVADNFDPLRKVYPFLDPAVYAPLVGRPLSEIPCPCGDHPSYAEHFLAPFLDALDCLRVNVELVRADQSYKSGSMTPCIKLALQNRERIAEILHEQTGKTPREDWSPFNPLCASCGRIDKARVTGFSASDETVSYECACGSAGEVPMAGGGKLVWRIDWAARWRVLGVTVEPFGKDHATRGGSYDTGKRISREVFDHEPPFPIPYEWIRLKGKGDMSSSKGNVLSIGRLLEVVPPEALRYLVIRERPQRSIGFDPGLPLLQLVDQVDDASAQGRDERALELSRAGEFQPVGVPFKHLVVVAQTSGFDTAKVLEILGRTGYPGVAEQALGQRMAYAKRWLQDFAPEELRFSVKRELPDEVAQLNPTQRSFLGRLAEGLEPGMDGERVHRMIYDLGEQFTDVKSGQLFQAIYLSLLGKSRGPRAGWFVTLLGIEFCAQRFREAAGGNR